MLELLLPGWFFMRYCFIFFVRPIRFFWLPFELFILCFFLVPEHFCKVFTINVVFFCKIFRW